MVNLTIRLNSKGGFVSTSGTPSASCIAPGIGAGAANSTTPRLVCGPHLTLSDLPLASGAGLIVSVHSGATAITGLGQKVRRQPGDKVHFCVRCNFPIAIYGRLDPCEHVFCLICAKKDKTCYLCEDRILHIQKIEVLEGMFICGVAGCLRSFLSKPEFEWHVKDAHIDLLPTKEAPLNKPNDKLQSQQSLGHKVPSSSPSLSQPPSPPPNGQQLENAVLGMQATSTLPAASEKQIKPRVLGPLWDRSETPSKWKKLEPQLGDGAWEKEKERETDGQKQGQRERDHGQQRDKEQQSVKDRERDRDKDRDRDRDTEREREVQSHSHRDRDRELWDQQQKHAHQQGGAHYPLPPPPLPPPFQSTSHQYERLAMVPPNQQGVTPSPYPPQPFPPFYPQQHDNRKTPRYDSSHHGPFLDPCITVSPDYQDNNAQGRHLQQDGERARNMAPQQIEGYSMVMDRQGVMLPHFHGEYGAPPHLGLVMGHQDLQGIKRFQEEGHGGGHLPPPKRGNFGHGGDSAMGHPQLMFGWGGPINFGGGPGHSPFMNWQSPQ